MTEELNARLMEAEKTEDPKVLKEHLVILSSQIGYMQQQEHKLYLGLCGKLQEMIHTVMPSYDGNNH